MKFFKVVEIKSNGRKLNKVVLTLNKIVKRLIRYKKRNIHKYKTLEVQQWKQLSKKKRENKL